MAVTTSGVSLVVMVSLFMVTESVSSIEYPSSEVMGVEERRGEPIGLLSEVEDGTVEVVLVITLIRARCSSSLKIWRCMTGTFRDF